tara:strand:- start:24 stop:377 length:354 start_codon:yes stop_codon:yes gene_type:complete
MNQKNLDALNAMQPQSVDDLNLVEVLDVEFGIKSEDDNGTIKIIDGSSMPSDAGISTAKANLLAKYQNSFYAKKRGVEYPRIGDQLDALYRDIKNGTLTTSGEFFHLIKTIKDKYHK